jgi:hypothetical protein
LVNNVSSSLLNRTIVVDIDYPNENNSAASDNTAHIFTSVVMTQPNNQSTVAALLCHPEYSLTLRQVTTDWVNSSTGNVMAVSDKAIEVHDLGTTQSQLTNDIMQFLFTNEFIPVQDSNPWITYLNYTTPQPNWEAFVNTSLLSKSFQTTFEALAVLTVKSTKMSSANRTISGLITWESPRLLVVPVSLRLMEALLVLMTLVSLALCLVDRGPDSMASSLPGLASILARSNELARIFSRIPATAESLARNLGGYSFAALNTPMRIAVYDTTSKDSDTTRRKQSHHPKSYSSRPWQPMATATTFRVFMIFTTLSLVATLEALYQLSRKRSGIVQVSADGYAKYAWLFVPTLAMSIIAQRYSSMDTAMRTLHPFKKMQSFRVKPLPDFDPQSHISIVSLLFALRRRYLGLSVFISTSILGSILVIAASGMYSAISIQNSSDIAPTIETWFDIHNGSDLQSRYDSLQFPPDVLFSQAILFDNMSYPPGTYDTYAFSTLTSSSLHGNDSSGSPSSLTARVPAARGQVNCSLYEFWDAISNTTGNGVLTLAIAPPPGCTKGSNDHLSNGTNVVLAAAGGEVPQAGYFAFNALLSWNLLNTSGPSYQADDRGPYTVCDDDIQHLFFFYGNQVGNDSTEVAVLHCLPYVESLLVDATFSLPSFAVDAASSPPSEEPGSASPWPSANNSIPLPTLPTMEDSNGVNVDAFFTALSRGMQGTPLPELTGRNNVDRMISRINQLYQQLVAQSLHFNFRQSIASMTAGGGVLGLTPKQIEGSVRSAAHTRLVQNALPTRSLECLLLILVFCEVASFWLVGKSRGLPVDPGSLAGKMSLLVERGMVECLAEVEEKLDGRESAGHPEKCDSSSQQEN